MKNYQINTNCSLVNDEKGTIFHVESDDYFATLATILSLWQQNKEIKKADYQELHDDLMMLQKNYSIKKRTN